MPDVSVIIPVYNVEKYLARCLDSVLGQTHRELEVICVNDGSPDGSAAILAGYAARDPRVRVLTQENRGQAAARNRGLEIAAGEWVTFVDSDDWIPRDAVAGFLAAARATGARAAVSDGFYDDRYSGEGERSLRWTVRKPALANLVGRRKLQSSPCNKLYHSSILKNHRFIEGIFFEDWPFVTEVFAEIDAFALVHAPLYVYCKNGNAASTIRSAFTVHKAESYMRGIEHVTGYFRDHPQRKWGMKRVRIAQKMLEKRMRKAGFLAKGFFWGSVGR